jgi:DNA-binding XRE family transcriptional regulator
LTTVPLLVYVADTMTGKELKRARASLKMTQEQLGDALGLHWNSIARMERAELPVVKQTELAIKYLLGMRKKQRGKRHGN